MLISQRNHGRHVIKRFGVIYSGNARSRIVAHLTGAEHVGVTGAFVVKRHITDGVAGFVERDVHRIADTACRGVFLGPSAQRQFGRIGDMVVVLIEIVVTRDKCQAEQQNRCQSLDVLFHCVEYFMD
jgi:hypothetical protein